MLFTHFLINIDSIFGNFVYKWNLLFINISYFLIANIFPFYYGQHWRVPVVQPFTKSVSAEEIKGRLLNWFSKVQFGAFLSIQVCCNESYISLTSLNRLHRWDTFGLISMEWRFVSFWILFGVVQCRFSLKFFCTSAELHGVCSEKRSTTFLCHAFWSIGSLTPQFLLGNGEIWERR